MIVASRLSEVYWTKIEARDRNGAELVFDLSDVVIICMLITIGLLLPISSNR